MSNKPNRQFTFGQYYSAVPYRTWLKAAALGIREERIWLCLFMQVSVKRRFCPSLYIPCTVQQIADYCDMDRGNASHALDHLAEAGLIEITDTSTEDDAVVSRLGRSACMTIELKLPRGWRAYYGVLGAGKPEIGDRILDTTPVTAHYVKYVPVVDYMKALNISRAAAHVFRAQLLAASCGTDALAFDPYSHLEEIEVVKRYSKKVGESAVKPLVTKASIRKAESQLRIAKLDAKRSVNSYCKSVRENPNDNV